MDVDRPDDREEEGEELCVGVGIVAGVEQVLPVVRAHRPVVVLAGAVDAGERLLVDEEHQAVLRGKPPHHAHHDHVVVRADRRRLVDRRHLELTRGDLVVARLGRDAEPPELAVEIHHEREDPLADRAEVLVLQLLALGRGGPEQGPTGEQEVGTVLGKPAVHQEVLLLGSDVREDALRFGVAEPAQDAQGVLAEGLLRSEQRDLVVQRLAGERHERRRDRQRDAVRLDLQEDRRRDVPGGVAARLERGADAARRE